MLRHIFSALAGLALGAAIISTPAPARGFGGGGGGGHGGGFGGGHFGGGGAAHFGGGGMAPFGGGGIAHFGGGPGRGRGFVGGNFAGPRVGVAWPRGPAVGRTHIGGLHQRFRHRAGIGFVDGSYGYDACDWPWRAQWRPYCDY